MKIFPVLILLSAIASTSPTAQAEDRSSGNCDSAGYIADMTITEYAGVPQASLYAPVGSEQPIIREATLLRTDNPFRKSKTGILTAQILGIILLIVLGVGLWAIFRPTACNRFFNGLAGRHITACTKLMHFRPLILMMVGGTAFKITDSDPAAFATCAVYELFLLIYRAGKLHSFRAAVVEAFYLLFYGIGFFGFCYIYLIFLFMGSGGTSRGKENNKEYGPCHECRNWRRMTDFDGFCTARNTETHWTSSCHNFHP